MENPYNILKKFLRWEELDLEAIVTCIGQKKDLVKCISKLENERRKNEEKIAKLKKGNHILKTKNSVLDEITRRDERVLQIGLEIKAANSLYHMITYY